MGQQGPVHADLCGILCGTGKCLAVPLSVSESWRRQVTLSWFLRHFFHIELFTQFEQKRKNSYLIISRSAGRV